MAWAVLKAESELGNSWFIKQQSLHCIILVPETPLQEKTPYVLPEM